MRLFHAVSILAMLLVPRTSFGGKTSAPPNIFIYVTDDQSARDCGAYGNSVVKTPAMDRIAKGGVVFTNGYCSVPSCSPDRASILTGRPVWQLEQAAIHFKIFPNKFAVLPDILEAKGYHIGYTGKGWAPGDFRYDKDGFRWKRNPAGVAYTDIRRKDGPYGGRQRIDYFANFQAFMKKRKTGAPFYFWFGPHEPHLPYDPALLKGMDEEYLRKIPIPPTLPDTMATRKHYALMYKHLEHSEEQMLKMMGLLEKLGELDNTLILATGDNGTPVPRAKSNLYEYGVKVPFLAMWKKRIPGGRRVTDFVSHSEIAPTVLDAIGIKAPSTMTARSFLETLMASKSGRVDVRRNHIITGMEMHNYTKPARMISDGEFAYIRNYKWAKTAEIVKGQFQQKRYDSARNGYNIYPLMIHSGGHPDIYDFAVRAYGPRAAEELYDLTKDPWQLNNLAASPQYAEIKRKLKNKLETKLRADGDPRMTGHLEVFAAVNEWVDQQNRARRKKKGMRPFAPYVGSEE